MDKPSAIKTARDLKQYAEERDLTFKRLEAFDFGEAYQISNCSVDFSGEDFNFCSMIFVKYPGEESFRCIDIHSTY